jgi:hypothetical protein
MPPGFRLPSRRVGGPSRHRAHLVRGVAGLGHHGQPHNRHSVVVRRNAVSPYHPTPKTLVDNRLFPRRANVQADWRHHRPAVAFPVSRVTSIDMTGVETERTVIAMSSAADRWSNDRLALLAAELSVAGFHLLPSPDSRLLLYTARLRPGSRAAASVAIRLSPLVLLIIVVVVVIVGAWFSGLEI